MKVGDPVRIKNDSFRSGQTGVIVRADVYNEQLKVDVHLVCINDRELCWFTDYQMEANAGHTVA